MLDSRKNKKQDMETSRAGSHYRRWRRREKKELCGLEVVMVSRVGAIVGSGKRSGKAERRGLQKEMSLPGGRAPKRWKCRNSEAEGESYQDTGRFTILR